jgi:hypothetical protein
MAIYGFNDLGQAGDAFDECGRCASSVLDNGPAIGLMSSNCVKWLMLNRGSFATAFRTFS